MRKFSSIITVAILTFRVVAALGQSATGPSLRSSSEVERRVDSILVQMTLEEKLALLGGVDGFFIREIPRLNLPRLKMADGPLGVRNFGPATAFAGGVALTATWNPALAERVGIELGRDCRAKGVHFLLAPGVNINRAPMNGRNFEYFGEDPFLASRMAVNYIKGVQSQGVSATVKHFMGNNSEFDRHNTDSIIDERTLREIYLPAFEAAVKEAHVGSVMSSYNLTNGLHMSQNKYLLTEVLKNEWGFDGLIMSDWSGTYDGIEAANAGQDLEMPSGLHMNEQVLKPAIEQNKVSVATVDDKVRRILRTAVRFGWLDRDQVALTIPRYNPQGRQVALDAARESIALLKNERALLPLNKSKIKSLLIIGPDAFPAVSVGGGSAEVAPFAAVSYLEGLANYPAKDPNNPVQVYYDRGLLTYSDLANATNFTTSPTNKEPGLTAEYFSNLDLAGKPVITRNEEHVDYGTAARLLFPEQTFSSRWSGYYTAQDSGAYEVFVQTHREIGGSYRLYVDDKLVLDNWKTLTALCDYRSLRLEPGPHKIVLEQTGRGTRRAARLRMGIVRSGQFVSENAKKLAASAEVVVMAVGFDAETEAESADRTFRLPLGQDELIQEMAAVNKNTIVVITSGGSVDMNAWLERVPVLVQAWYPGQEGGTALAEILFGDVNPSGRLPVTFERRWKDNPVYDSYYPEAGTKRVVYKEGVFVGYRGYEHNHTKPLFPFGFGLSYTTFAYSNLSVKPTLNSERSPRFEVSFDVKNTGTREGADVAQVYVSAIKPRIPRPPKELKGFAKLSLRPGETRRVSVILDRRALSYYDVETRQWRASPGDFNVLVGRSSESIELRGKLTLTDP
ncbi:MAG TPA: glycoside hydrolase family 3 C-terminal domain-containing protein [Pyrinomonadaceae bacterium]|jgi:beta-glucosidase|nr:glycoside hydrolase family 3 C-terminal domain-containing protein [Pyrinomonadaceae bacterium]